jgi:phage portal protein BeeE
MGYPYYLLGEGENRTYDNAPQDEKFLYNNTIIPEAEHFNAQRTKYLLPDTEGVKIMSDFSHVAAMQEDEGKKAKAAKDWAGTYKIYWESDLMTRNQILEAQDMKKVTDGDLYKSEWDKKIQNEGNE